MALLEVLSRKKHGRVWLCVPIIHIAITECLRLERTPKDHWSSSLQVCLRLSHTTESALSDLYDSTATQWFRAGCNSLQNTDTKIPMPCSPPATQSLPAVELSWECMVDISGGTLPACLPAHGMLSHMPHATCVNPLCLLRLIVCTCKQPGAINNLVNSTEQGFFFVSVSLLLFQKYPRNYLIWQVSTFTNTFSGCIPWPLLFVTLPVYIALLSLIFNFVMSLHRANISPLGFSAKRVRKPSVPLVFPAKHCPNLWPWLVASPSTCFR